MTRRIGCLVAALLIASSGAVEAQNLGVSQGTTNAYGYGFPQNNLFSAAVNTAFGGAGNVSVMPDISGGLGGFSSLLLDLRDFNNGATTTLSATEAANLAAFIASGRRVLIFGENASWSEWNNSFLGVLGGTFGGTGTNAPGNPLVANAITNGVGSIQTQGAPGVANGGTQLFSNPYVNLWGGGQNVLSILDVNTCTDQAWNLADNAVFCTNVADWLADDVVAVPEPATALLLMTGLFGMVFIRRRRFEA